MIKLDNGDRVKDTISGFVGIVIGRTVWNNGCVRLTVRPEGVSRETGKPYEAETFDDNDLELVKAKVIKAVRGTDDPGAIAVAAAEALLVKKPKAKKVPGGPMPKVSMF